jgi:hypothetical protein
MPGYPRVSIVFSPSRIGHVSKIYAKEVFFNISRISRPASPTAARKPILLHPLPDVVVFICFCSAVLHFISV